jgi:N-acetylglutamate synthase-like GNAT family acetyltransferase
MIEKRTYLDIYYGNIDYTFIKDEVYENGLIVLDGAIVHKEYRGRGKFKVMLKALLEEYPEGTLIQAAVITNKLAKMFERMGMTRVKRIEVWGNPSNCKLLEGKLDKSSLKNI